MTSLNNPVYVRGYRLSSGADRHEFKPYVYGGTEFSESSKRLFDPSACGTYAGYRRHVDYKVPTCDPCIKAARQRWYEERQNRKNR